MPESMLLAQDAKFGHPTVESKLGWRWIGGAHQFMIRRDGHAYRITSEICKDHGCGKTCFAMTGPLSAVLEYANRRSASQGAIYVEQVRRNIARVKTLDAELPS